MCGSFSIGSWVHGSCDLIWIYHNPPSQPASPRPASGARLIENHYTPARTDDRVDPGSFACRAALGLSWKATVLGKRWVN